MSVLTKGLGGGKKYSLVKDVKGSYNASTTVIHTMTKNGFVIGCYGGHNSSNLITIYLNGTQIASDGSGRTIAESQTLNRTLSAGDIISVKGNSNSWNGIHLFFYEED